MMKPDTPKFAPDSLEFHAQRLVEHYDMAQNADHRSCFQDAVHCLRDKLSRIAAAPKPPQQIDLEELKQHCVEESEDHSGCMELAINWLHAKGFISVAPKPDCVGVEELKKNVRDADQPDGWNGSYVHPYDIGWNECLDYLVKKGLLAVKEKPSE